MNVLPLPDDARRDVREQAWPNRKEEDAATWEADQNVFARVRQFENLLADHGLSLAASGQETLDAASENLHAIAAFRQDVGSGTVLMDSDAAKRYENAEASVTDTIASLERLRAQIEHAIGRCEDPMAALQSTLSRFPALRSGRTYVR